jgi:hypothetical protein
MEENKELVTQTLDLDPQEIDEALLASQGVMIKTIMGAMFGGFSLPVQVRGNVAQIASFATALGKEKDFMEAFSKYGLDNPKTYKSKGALDSAVRKFERVTKLKWPFK